MRGTSATVSVQFSRVLKSISISEIGSDSEGYLSWCTLCAIHWGALFSFTEILVVRVTAPKLLAGVVSSELNENGIKKKKKSAIVRYLVSHFLKSSKISLGANKPFFVCFFIREHYSWHIVWQATYSGAHFITDTKIKAALLVHGVIYPREFRQLWPLVLKGIIQQTVVGAGKNRGVKKKSWLFNQEQPLSMICTEMLHKLNTYVDKVECQGLKTQHTECIDWAPVCCSVTSDSDGMPLELVEPWCCPCWSHQHSGCPGRHAPCLAWWGRKKRNNVKKGKKRLIGEVEWNQKTYRPEEKYWQLTLLVSI